MNKPRLQTLKSTLSTLPSRFPTPMTRSGSAGVRWSGRKLQDWRARILSAEPLCRHCQEASPPRVTAATEVDHIVPLSQGGDYSDSNACPLCGPCHKAKTAKDMGYRSKREIGSDGWPT